MVPARLSKPIPQPKGKTRLAVEEDARKADEGLLATWRTAIRKRDGERCRCCHRRVLGTLKLQANRAECHHLTGRAHKPTRYDVRNGVLLCLACHQKVEQCELQIVGVQQFVVGNRSYTDANGPLAFKELA